MTCITCEKEITEGQDFTTLVCHASGQWVKKLMNWAAAYSGELDIYCETTRSETDEVVRPWRKMAPMLLAVSVLMALYCMYTMGGNTRKQADVPRIRSQYGAVACVVASPLLATFCAFGVLGYCGLTINTFCLYAPFLVLGGCCPFLLFSSVVCCVFSGF